jgi:phosphohistidine phosphatase
MIIYIFRHGIAAPKDDPAVRSDPDRPLTAEGIEKTRAAAGGLKRLTEPIDIVLTSPWLRAKQTAEIVCEVLDVQSRLQEMAELAGDRRVEDVLLGLGRYRTHHSIMLVGHQPLLGEVAAHLLSLSQSLQVDLKKSGICAVEVERIPPKSPGTLLWMMTPKQLRMLR